MFPSKPIDMEYVKARVAEGISQRQVAEEVGVDPKTISRRLLKLGASRPRSGFYRKKVQVSPSAHPLVKELIDVDKLDSIQRLAKRAGYSHMTIRRWISGTMGMSLVAFSDVAEAMGYRIRLEPMEQ